MLVFVATWFLPQILHHATAEPAETIQLIKLYLKKRVVRLLTRCKVVCRIIMFSFSELKVRTTDIAQGRAQGSFKNSS